VRAVFKVPFVLSHDITPHSLSVVIDATNHVCPALEFSSPMLNSGKRNDNEERTMDLLNAVNMLNVGNNLNSFSKTCKALC
jgi:hypothetical protein